MSLFGANSAQPVHGIPTTPTTTRSNPDRQRREKREKKGEGDHAARKEDRADLSSVQGQEAPADVVRDEGPRTPPEERPRLDVQG